MVRFYLSGHPFDMEMLRDLFPRGSGADWFGEDQDGTFFVSAPLEDIAEAGDRHRAAERALVRAVGLGRLLDSNLHPVTLTGRHVDSVGIHQVIAADTAVVRMSAGTPTVLNDGVPVEKPPPTAPDYLALADTTPAVAEVLDLVGRSDLSWIDLYKVYEIIRHEAGGDASIESNGWANIREQGAFRASANREDVSGSAARHARASGQQRPKLTMTLPEAQAFIRRLTTNWLRSLK